MRARVTLAASGVLALIMAVGAIALVAQVNRSLVASLDSAAMTRARDVSSLVVAPGLRPTLPTPIDGSSLVQVVDHTNTVVSASTNIQGEPPIFSRLPASGQDIVVTVAALPIANESQSFRVAAHAVTLADGPGWVYVAASLAQVDTATRTLSWSLAVAVPLLIAGIALIIRTAVAQSLKPIESIRRQAAAVGADPSQRVPVPDTRDEVSRLATTVNHMLDRLEASAIAQKRFIGDASHELRGPLATLRAQVDVALDPRTGADAVAALRAVLVQANRMASLIDDLLFLAHTDEGRPRRIVESVDLDEIVIEEFHRLESVGTVQVRLSDLQAVRTAGRRGDLARLVRNIGDNAVRHAVSTVWISLTVADADAVITIANDGPAIPEADRTRIFDRFTRLDPARARTAATGDGGSGLGLAIAAEIAATHGGRIATGPLHDSVGAVFVVTLPVRPAPGEVDDDDPGSADRA